MNDLEDRLRHMYARVGESAKADIEVNAPVVPLRPLGPLGARPAWRRIVAAAAALAVLGAGGWLLRQRATDDVASPSDADRIYGIPLWVPEGYAFHSAAISDAGVATLEWRRGSDSLFVKSGPTREMGVNLGAIATVTTAAAKVAIFGPPPVDDKLVVMLWMVDAETLEALTAKAGFVTNEWQRWDIPGDPIDRSDLIVSGGLQTGLRVGLELGYGWLSSPPGCRALSLPRGEREWLLTSDTSPVEFHVLMGDGTRRTISGEVAPGMQIALATAVGDVQSVTCKDPT